MKTKRKYLANWVRVKEPDSPFFNKYGVVMDEEYVHNGVMCCRVIIDKDVVPIEAQYLVLIHI